MSFLGLPLCLRAPDLSNDIVLTAKISRPSVYLFWHNITTPRVYLFWHNTVEMSYAGSYATSYGSSGSDSSGQIVGGLVIVILIFIVSLTGEIMYKTVYEARSRYQTIVDYTADSQDSTINIHQDASKYSNAIPIGLSVNERSGIEFAYSFYIYVLPSSFSPDSANQYKHVFHKGYGFPWPLMGPGVFMNATNNTMRVVMNTYKNPYTYADVINFPIQKWVHVVLNCFNNGLDIFVNGELATRISFTGTLPYQNFQDIVLFSNVNSNTLSGGTAPIVLGSDTLRLAGSFAGNLSNVIYTRYALSVIEIQNLMNRGPSSKSNTKVMQRPPYLADDWWANQQR